MLEHVSNLRLRSQVPKELFIFLFSIFFVKVFVALALWRNGFDFASPDSKQYLALSENLFQSYLTKDHQLFETSLLRTPIYPMLLSIIASNVFLAILLNVLLIHLTGLIIYLTVLKSYGIRTAKYAVVFFLIEPATFVGGYYVLAEALFTFLVATGLYFLTLSIIDNKKSLVVVSGLLFGLAALTRPIGIVLLIPLIVSLLISHEKRYSYAVISMLSMMFIVFPWALWNYFRAGMFALSSIQAGNLLSYEAAGAVALRSGVPLEVVQEREMLLLERSLGENASFLDAYDYSIGRAWTLIGENFLYFVILHLIGIFKTLLGFLGQDLIEICSKLVPTESAICRVGTFFAGSLSILVTCCLSVGVFVAIRGTRKIYGFIIIFFFLFLLIVSSGAQAYGRFKIPLMPFIAPIVGLGWVWFTNAKQRLRR